MRTRSAAIQRCACGKSKPAPLSAPRGFGPEPVQRSVGDSSRETAGVHPGVLRPSAGGAPLPGTVQAKMEAAFGHDFGDVRVHHGGEAESIGAVAFTRGTHLHFAPGRYQPHSAEGQKLLGHELAHVVQQRAKRVARPGGAVPINADPALEREADAAGARVASSRPADVQGAAPGGGAAFGGPAIQPMMRAKNLASMLFGSPLGGQVIKRGYRTGLPENTPLITGYTQHGQQQTDSRDGGKGVDQGAQYDAVHGGGQVVDQPDKGTTKYVGKDASVVLNKDGKVVTSWGHSKKGTKGRK